MSACFVLKAGEQAATVAASGAHWPGGGWDRDSRRNEMIRQGFKELTGETVPGALPQPAQSPRLQAFPARIFPNAPVLSQALLSDPITPQVALNKIPI